MLEVVASVLAVVCKRMQQLSTLLGQQCWMLLRPCWQWCANGCNISQQCWGLHCIMGRIQPIRRWKPFAMSARGPKNVRRAVQTDPTVLCYASAIMKQQKCWELLAPNFAQQLPTTCNRLCKRTQYVTSNNVGSCCVRLHAP